MKKTQLKGLEKEAIKERNNKKTHLGQSFFVLINVLHLNSWAAAVTTSWFVVTVELEKSEQRRPQFFYSMVKTNQQIGRKEVRKETEYKDQI